jgi:NADH dehydrogenase FAD-containing subunit
LEKRASKKVQDANVLLTVFKKRMKEEMKDFSIMEEGKLARLGGPQAFLICTFKDRRDIQLVQLVQYWVTRDSLLQLIISDRPEGFRNLLEVIRKIHGSLRVEGAKLK